MTDVASVWIGKTTKKQESFILAKQDKKDTKRGVEPSADVFWDHMDVHDIIPVQAGCLKTGL